MIKISVDKHKTMIDGGQHPLLDYIQNKILNLIGSRMKPKYILANPVYTSMLNLEIHDYMHNAIEADYEVENIHNIKTIQILGERLIIEEKDYVESLSVLGESNGDIEYD